MKPRRFIHCDVFSPVPTLGNALAVVVDAEDLSASQMQQFAAWTNLAETTFLLPPRAAGADYRVRIFSPVREMPFAGHPTLGSCAAWLHCGGRPADAGTVRQQCGIGIVEIDIGDPQLPAFRAPQTRIGAIDTELLSTICTRLEIAEHLVVRSAELDNGPVFQALQLESAEAVLALDAARVRWPEFKSLGFIGAHRDGECDYEVRLLAPSSGMSEDPITGSLNSALACWLRSEGQLEGEIVIAQGTGIGRRGRVLVRVEDDERIMIAGRTHVVADGELLL